MNPIIEKVARALADSFKDRIAKAAAMPFSETGVATPNVFVWEEYARAAIRATLEGLRDNVSEGMSDVGEMAMYESQRAEKARLAEIKAKTGGHPSYVSAHHLEAFKAMLNQAIKEIE